MTDALVLAGIVAVIAVVAAVFLRARTGTEESGAYETNERLLTPAEGSFFGVLTQAVAGDLLVFPKVRMADVLRPRRTKDRSAWQAAFNKINAKHFDFVLCQPGTTEIFAVIELNDKSHGSRRRKARDSFVRSACSGAKLRLIEFSAKRSYVTQEIRDALLAPSSPTDEPLQPTTTK